MSEKAVLSIQISVISTEKENTQTMLELEWNAVFYLLQSCLRSSAWEQMLAESLGKSARHKNEKGVRTKNFGNTSLTCRIWGVLLARVWCSSKETDSRLPCKPEKNSLSTCRWQHSLPWVPGRPNDGFLHTQQLETGQLQADIEFPSSPIPQFGCLTKMLQTHQMYSCL